jgi:hypothetical protein
MSPVGRPHTAQGGPHEPAVAFMQGILLPADASRGGSVINTPE